MRIEQLRLDRYGLHSERSLEFPVPAIGRPDLHLVYGGNGTGKSSARAAITDLIFGFPNVCRWAVGFEPSQLKLGAVVAATGGRRLNFDRLKGRKVTLSDSTGNALDEALLKSFIGAIDRAGYEGLYALDQARLRKGGEDMLKAGSDLGQTIFAAASGLSALGEIRDALKAELDQIGTTHRGEKPIWAAEAAYTAAISRSQETALKIEEWNAAAEKLQDAEAKLSALNAEQTRLEADRTRIDRLTRALPVLLALEALRAEAEAKNGVRLLPQDFATRWTSAVERADAAVEALSRNEAARNRLLADRNALPQDAGPLHSFAADIEHLYTTVENIRVLIQDREKLERVADLAIRRLQDLAPGLGGGEPDALIKKIPASPVLGRIRDLITEHAGLETARRHSAEGKETAEDELKASRVALAELGSVAEPAEAAALMQAIRGLDADAKKAAKDQTALKAALDVEAQLLAALPGWSGNGAGLLAALFPDAMSVAEAKAAIERAARAEESAEEKVEEIEAALARIASELEASVGYGAIPSVEAVAAERAERDRQWQTLRAQAANGISPESETLDRYEGKTKDADDLVDRRLDGADLLAGQRQQTIEKNRLAGELARAEQARARARGSYTMVIDRAKALWSGTSYSGEVGAPEAMQAWLRLKDKAADAVRARLDAETEAESSKRTLSSSIQTLRQSATLLGVAPPDSIATQAEIQAGVARVNTALTTAQAQWTKAGQLGIEIKKREAASAKAGEKLAAAEAALGQWQQRWAAALPALNLPAGADISEVKAAIEQWELFTKEATQLKTSDRRADGIRNDLAAHRAEIDALIEGIGRDVLAKIVGAQAPDDETWQRWPAVLYNALGLAKTLAQEIQRADRVLREAETGLSAAQEAAAAAKALSYKLRTDAGLAEGDDIETAIEASNARRGIETSIAERVKQLSETGEQEASIRLELGQQNRDTLEQEVLANATARKTVIEDLQLAADEKAQCRENLKRLEERSGFATAEHEALNHALKVGELARRWMLVTAQRLILDAAIERYRHQHEAPLVKRANEIFIAIAGTQAPDHFTQLDVDYQKPNEPHLIVLRANLPAARVEELSEGTRDQLWLAFRIAALERRAEEAEAMPFLADDLFASSDPVRAEAGLKYLAELARGTQVILFTHHAYVVEAASKLVPGLNVIELQRPPLTSAAHAAVA